MNNKSVSKELRMFSLFLIAFSAIAHLWVYQSKNYFLSISLLMWMPGIASIVTLLLCKKKFFELQIIWPGKKAVITAFIIPVIYVSIVYCLCYVTGWAGIDNNALQSIQKKTGFGFLPLWAVFVIYAVIQGVLGTITSCASAIGEEIGWRGFLLPRVLQFMNPFKASLLVGIVWAVWHYPLMLSAVDFSKPGEWLPGMLFFTIMVIALSYIYTYFTIKSSSILPAVILHASHNNFLQKVYDPFTSDTGNTFFFIEETGILVPTAAIIIALFLFLKTAQSKKNLAVLLIAGLLTFSNEARSQINQSWDSSFRHQDFSLNEFTKFMKSTSACSADDWDINYIKSNKNLLKSIAAGWEMEIAI